MRSIWTGSLSFGLINIPVRLYNASEERALKFRLLEKDNLCPISYAKVCRETGKEVRYEDIVKGYEYEKGDYVILLDEDFKKANPKKSQSIEIVEFVEEKEIDPKYYEKPYYIEPDKKSVKAYALLAEALRRSKKVGVGRFVLREKEHLVAVRPAAMETAAGLLMLETLRFQDEIRNPEELHIPEKAEYSKKELDIALSLIDQLTAHFKPEDFKDTYTEELKKMIEAKAKGKPLPKTPKPGKPTEATELLKILQESLEKEKARER